MESGKNIESKSGKGNFSNNNVPRSSHKPIRGIIKKKLVLWDPRETIQDH